MSEIESVRAALLVQDTTLYPRTTVNEYRVRRLHEARMAGKTLPPIVACRDSRRVSDGFHRVTERLRYDGPDAMIDVEWRDYADEAALFLDAVRLNSPHGQPLNRIDEVRCMEIARQLGVSDAQLADVLALTEVKAAEIKAQRTAEGPSGQSVVLKAANRHLAGTTLTDRQVAGNARSNGHPLRFHVDQVINALDNGLADLGETGLLDRLAHLATVLARFVTTEQERDVG